MWVCVCVCVCVFVCVCVCDVTGCSHNKQQGVQVGLRVPTPQSCESSQCSCEYLAPAPGVCYDTGI